MGGPTVHLSLSPPDEAVPTGREGSLRLAEWGASTHGNK